MPVRSFHIQDLLDPADDSNEDVNVIHRQDIQVIRPIIDTDPTHLTDKVKEQKQFQHQQQLEGNHFGNSLILWIVCEIFGVE